MSHHWEGPDGDRPSLPSTFDLAPTIVRHRIPITVIQGDVDYIDPAAQSWNFLTKANGIAIFVIPQASHYSWIDDPSRFEADLHRGLVRSF